MSEQNNFFETILIQKGHCKNTVTISEARLESDLTQEFGPDSSIHETVNLGNDSSNLEFTSDLTRSQPEIQPATSSINVEPDSTITRPQPQTGTKKKSMFSFSTIRNIFRRSSVSYSLLVTCPQWLNITLHYLILGPLLKFTTIEKNIRFRRMS